MFEPLLFAYLTGLTLSGLTSALLELNGKTPVRFKAPYISRDFPLRSYGNAVLAGPAMLLNETHFFWKRRQMSTAVFLTTIAIVNAWVLSMGILTLQGLHLLFP